MYAFKSSFLVLGNTGQYQVCFPNRPPPVVLTPAHPVRYVKLEEVRTINVPISLNQTVSNFEYKFERANNFSKSADIYNEYQADV